MEQHFRRVYKNKTREELEHVVHSYQSYHKDAVRVAIQLLQENYGTELPLPFEERINKYHGDTTTYDQYLRTFMQYPAYGFAIDKNRDKGKLGIIMLIILLIHVGLSALIMALKSELWS